MGPDTRSVLRARVGKDKADVSVDAEIDAMSADEKFRHVCGWHLGQTDWADTVLHWAKECGLKVAPLATKETQ